MVVEENLLYVLDTEVSSVVLPVALCHTAPLLNKA